MNLTRYKKYSRNDLHDLASTEVTFKPGAGKWGLHGIVNVPDTKNDFVFFVSFGHKEGRHSFKEGISEDGELTWQSQPNQMLHYPQIRKLINHDESQSRIYLLLRTNPKDKYTYLGDLAYTDHDPNKEKPVWFTWQIIDWEINTLTFDEIGLTLGTLDSGSNNSPTARQKLKPNQLLDDKKKPKERKKRSTPVGKRQGKQDHEQKAKSNKAIGEAGELLVMEHEMNKLKKLGMDKTPIHIALTDDNAGYDILSFNTEEEEIYIEVKTTTGTIQQPFFVTANEVKVSEEKGDNYFIYRLYEFDKEMNAARMYQQEGPIASGYELIPKDFTAYFNG